MSSNRIVSLDTLLRASDVANYLNISRAFAYKLMQQGEIPTVRLGRARRVRTEDLIKFIERNRRVGDI